MDKKKRKKDLRDTSLPRGELGELLRLFSSLGVTVAAGIIGFFVLGLYLDRKLVAMGWETRGIPRVVMVLAGVVMSLYWAYLRINRHLEKFEEKDDSADGKPGDPPSEGNAP